MDDDEDDDDDDEAENDEALAMAEDGSSECCWCRSQRGAQRDT